MKLQRKYLFACMALAVACLTGVSAAQAGVATYTSQASFGAAGTIAYNSNFDDFGTGFGFPTNPFTRGDVTYGSVQNLTFGDATGYTPLLTPTLIGNNFWNPIIGTINTAPQYDMFGYNIGAFASGGLQTLNVTTNFATYSFGPLSISTTSLEFRGFITDLAGEYFTGFSIQSSNGSGSLPGITNVQVGNTGVRPEGVPEPGSLIVFGALGAIGMVVGYRRRQQVA